MNKQSVLIGKHPIPPNCFGLWFDCIDADITATKCHRSLTEKLFSLDDIVVDWFARKLINHHYSDYRLEKLKQNYRDIGYPKYAEQHRKLPKSDKTKKGNATEILLTEYVESCLGKALTKVFKLKYNPNVDQAMKGDDTLMVDVVHKGNMENVKLYLGEAKFRKQPSKTVVDEIAKALEKNKTPISYSFLVDELGRNYETRELANTLDKFLVDEIKSKGDLTYTGFLLSNTNTSKCVESNLKSKNPALIFISVSIENPEELITKAFEKAEHLIKHPDDL